MARGSASVPILDRTPDYREALVAPHHPLILNPLLARADPASHDLTRLLYRGLLRLDSSAVPVSDLAAGWSVSGDGLVYRFPLPSALRWSDGSPLRARDVLASVGMVQAPDFPDATWGAAWAGVAVGVDASGAVVTLTLPAPRASFATTVADLPIIQAAEASRPLSALVAARTAAMPTSGPYRVAVSDDARVLLEPNTFAATHPSLRLLEMTLEPTFEKASRDLAAGEVDALTATSPSERSALAALPGVHVRDMTSFRFVDVVLNARRPVLGDVAVRRALSAAVNRRQLIATALHGAATPQVDAEPVGIGWLGHPSQEQSQPEAAARALDAAGWSAPSPGAVRARAGRPLTLTLSVPDAAPLPDVARELARQFRTIGVGVSLQTVPPDTAVTVLLTSEMFDMALVDWDSGPDPDLTTFWRSDATPPRGSNVSGTGVDVFLDSALDNVAVETDGQQRIAAARRVDQRLADDVPAVFLYAPVTSFATQSTITGVSLPAAGAPADRYEQVTAWRRAGGGSP